MMVKGINCVGEVVHGVLVSRDHMWLSLVSYAGMNA